MADSATTIAADVKAGRRRTFGDIQRCACAQSSEGFADDPEMERRFHGLSPADPDREPGGQLTSAFQHACLAETGLADHE